MSVADICEARGRRSLGWCWECSTILVLVFSPEEEVVEEEVVGRVG